MYNFKGRINSFVNSITNGNQPIFTWHLLEWRSMGLPKTVLHFFAKGLGRLSEIRNHEVVPDRVVGKTRIVSIPQWLCPNTLMEEMQACSRSQGWIERARTNQKLDNRFVCSMLEKNRVLCQPSWWEEMSKQSIQ